MSDTINRARRLADKMAETDVVSFGAVQTVIRELCAELESESCENSRLKRLIEEAKATFDDIASSPTPKPLELCDYCNQWPDGGTACCNEYDGSVHYKEPVSEEPAPTVPRQCEHGTKMDEPCMDCIKEWKRD